MLRTGRLPRCVQEGLILKALLTNNPHMLKNYPLEKDTYDYVKQFKDYYVKHHGEKDLSKKMKKKFGYSYCYYFSFGIGAKQNTDEK